MEISIFTFKSLRFPARAGDLQDQGASASLIRELGDNYDTYHEFLANELQRFGGRPVPDDFTTAQAYLAAEAHLQEVVMAELLLRNARAFRGSGAALDAGVDPACPMVDSSDHLVRQPESAIATAAP